MRQLLKKRRKELAECQQTSIAIEPFEARYEHFNYTIYKEAYRVLHNKCTYCLLVFSLPAGTTLLNRISLYCLDSYLKHGFETEGDCLDYVLDSIPISEVL